MKKLLVVEDTLRVSAHYGPHLQRMTQGVLAYARKEAQQASPGLPYPAGANGGDSSMVLAYLRERLDVHAPDILLLNCGLYDLRTDPQSGAKQIAPWDYRQNLCAIQQDWMLRDRPAHT